MGKEKRKVILDCDPGHDDAIAILLAGLHPDIEVVGITTVAGNVEVEKTTDNALKVCQVGNLLDIPVAKGMNQPLVRMRETAPAIHGDSGMDGPVLPKPEIDIIDEHAVDFIIRTLLESKDTITLVPTGPLSNIAMAIRREPKILNKIEEIVLMGGGSFGNWTPAAEFNIYVDAEAAKVIFESGLPITMMGLDVTHQALATVDVIDKMASIDNKVGVFIVDLLKFFKKTYLEVFGFQDPPVHDVCCIAYLIDPSLFKAKFLRVDIETKGELSYGMTLIDFHGVTEKEPNVNVALSLDRTRFWDLLNNTFKHFNS